MTKHGSDLVADSRIEASFLPDSNQTRHLRDSLGTTARHRIVQTEEIWQRQRRIGGGTFGVVWLEECISGPPKNTLRAVKEIRMDESLTMIDYHRELETIAKFSKAKFAHCFVQSSGWFSTDSTIFIAMEYISHGDLQRYMSKCLPELEAKQVTYQIVEGVQFMHENGFAHRDLKPGNVLVFKPGPAWWVKIGDFGISKRLEGSTALRTFQVGTRGYVAPEILGLFHPDDPDDPEVTSGYSYTTAVDIWAIGEITARMVAGKPSFSEPRALYRYVIQGEQFPTANLEVAGVSPNCCDFIQNMMAPSPMKRFNTKRALEHLWLQTCEFIDDPTTPTAIGHAIDPDMPSPPSTVPDEASAQWTEILPSLRSGTPLNPQLGAPSRNDDTVSSVPSVAHLQTPAFVQGNASGQPEGYLHGGTRSGGPLSEQPGQQRDAGLATFPGASLAPKIEDKKAIFTSPELLPATHTGTKSSRISLPWRPRLTGAATKEQDSLTPDAVSIAKPHQLPHSRHGVDQTGGSGKSWTADMVEYMKRTPIRARPQATGAFKEPSRDASEVLNQIIISQPEIEIEKESARLSVSQQLNVAGRSTGERISASPLLPSISGQQEGTRPSDHRHPHSGKREKVSKFGDYILGNTIGEGNSAKVKLAWKQDGDVQVAIKLIRRYTIGSSPRDLARVYREIVIQRGLTHPNIARLREMIETERHIGIVLEYASGGELTDYVLHHRYLRDPSARRLFAQLVSGVGYLHKKGIVHRDISRENLVLDRNRNLIIIDFGCANTFNSNDKLDGVDDANLADRTFVKQMGWDKINSDGTRKGDLMETRYETPQYRAPEMVVGDSLYVGRKVDVWGCGVVLYFMLAGYMPFDDDPENPDAKDIKLLYKYIANKPLTFPGYVTAQARDLLRLVVVPDPRQRIDLFGVARHSWLSEYAHIVELMTSSR